MTGSVPGAAFPMPFEFSAPARIVYGPGAFRQTGTLARALGRRAWVVTGLAPLIASFGTVLPATPADGRAYSWRAHGHRPGSLQPAAAAEMVIGFGGGSALDAAAIAALVATAATVDYLEVVGRGKVLSESSLPVLAIPTTAGTGSEVTKNAVLASPEHGVKASLRSAAMIPRIAIVDPELTCDLPPAITASTGLDALTQLMEPLTSARSTPLTDCLCRDGIARVARSLRRACINGHDVAARADMSLASLYGARHSPRRTRRQRTCWSIGGMFKVPMASARPAASHAGQPECADATPTRQPVRGGMTKSRVILTGTDAARAPRAQPVRVDGRTGRPPCGCMA